MRNRKIKWTAAAAALLILGCGKSSENQEVEKTPAQEVSSSTPQAAQAASGQLQLTPSNTQVTFVGRKVIGSHDGSFSGISGTVEYQNGDPLTASVNVRIDLSTVTTDAPKLDEHLKSPDFFDVARFPVATFVSTGVKAGGQNGATHTVSGTLTLHGVPKEISIPASIVVSEKEVTMSSEFLINRQDFGIVYPGMPDNLIKDEVTIRLQIKGQL